MRRAAKKDLVHAPIVEGLRMHDIEVEDMPQPGDVLCYGFHADFDRFMFVPMEFKTPRELLGTNPTLTKRQQARVMPIPKVTTLSEALALFGRSL
jgi:hypothetical protein